MQDLIAGRIDYQCPLATTGLPHIESGAVKAIAALSKSRASVLPNLPTAHEQGLVDFDTYYWNAIFAPRNTPPAVVQKLHDALLILSIHRVSGSG
jgi:tripartite-type tricarboxylate transporter receptor subunit TctC